MFVISINNMAATVLPSNNEIDTLGVLYMS